MHWHMGSLLSSCVIGSSFSQKVEVAMAMRDRSDRYQVQTVPLPPAPAKRLGSYLIEAGLLTPGQVEVALNDQKMTGMRFGEILAARGWVKQQTIEYLMKKVITPEKQAAQKQAAACKETVSQAATVRQPIGPVERPSTAGADVSTDARPVSPQDTSPGIRREIPIAKPLPSFGHRDEDVSWVG